MKVYRVYVKFHNADISENGPRGQEAFLNAESCRDAVRQVLGLCPADFAAIMIDELPNAVIIPPSQPASK